MSFRCDYDKQKLCFTFIIISYITKKIIVLLIHDNLRNIVIHKQNSRHKFNLRLKHSTFNLQVQQTNDTLCSLLYKLIGTQVRCLVLNRFFSTLIVLFLIKLNYATNFPFLIHSTNTHPFV